MATVTTGAFRLYLLRHARAGWAAPGKADFDRTLDDQGYAEAEILAEEMADQGYRPQVVISSTAVRATTPIAYARSRRVAHERLSKR